MSKKISKRYVMKYQNNKSRYHKVSKGINTAVPASVVIMMQMSYSLLYKTKAIVSTGLTAENCLRKILELAQLKAQIKRLKVRR